MFYVIKERFVFTLLLYIVSNFSSYSLDKSLKFNFKFSQNLTGFHRLLCYDVYIQGVNGGSKLLIRDTLPKDIYIDPYQVSEKNGVYIKELVDCEAPAYLANTMEVQLCSLSINNAHHICFPIHLRYQLPHQCEVHSKSIPVYKKVPSIFIQEFNNLSSALPNDCFINEKMESWIDLGNPEVQSLKYEIPVGCTEHFYWVLFLLTITIGFSVIYLSNNLLKANFI